MMDQKELLSALNRLKVETGSLACLGCGHEHKCSTKGCAIIRKAAEELARYEQAEKEGRLVELPCKVGDTIYIVSFDGYSEPDVLIEAKVCDFSISKCGIPLMVYMFGFMRRAIEVNKFGKLWFLSKEEAIATLK